MSAEQTPDIERVTRGRGRRGAMSVYVDSWLQDKASGVHFDVTDSKRRQALAMGALPLEIGSEPWSRVLDEARQQFSGPKRPRRFPVVAEPQHEAATSNNESED